jgi:hypothetical protein
MSFKQRQSKELTCACGEVVKNVDVRAVKITCWRCVSAMLKGFRQTETGEIELVQPKEDN